MPFGFLKRRKTEPSGATGRADAPRSGTRHGVEFEGLTEDWRLRGVMKVSGRMSDALNKREAIAIADVQWGPPDGSAPLEPAPGLRSVDPYDLILVVPGAGSLPMMSDAEQGAHRIHKVNYDVALEVPPYRVIGTVHLYPGAEPDRLLDRATEMFIAVTDAVAMMGDTRVTDADHDVILVNRFYLRGVMQVDKRTGERHQPLPGAPLGGVSWQDRSR
jgi:hypothetical protein